MILLCPNRFSYVIPDCYIHILNGNAIVFIVIALKIMVNPQDNTQQSDSTLESSQNNHDKVDQKPNIKKERLKFKEKDMYKIKHNF